MKIYFAIVCLGGGLNFSGQAGQHESSNTIRQLPEYSIRNSSPAIADLNRDGYSEIIFVSLDPPSCESGCFFNVHALDGAADYAQELPGWPRLIQTGVFDFLPAPTVSIGDINFDDSLDVLVGGNIENEFCPSGGTRSVFAFNADGSDVAGWECISAEFPPFFNAGVVTDANADGAPEYIVADESTYLQRYNSMGRKWQCIDVSDPVYASPAVGDVGRWAAAQADGIPDAVITGSPYYFRAYDTFGTYRNCGLGNLLIYFSDSSYQGYFTASPALADLDGDGTQDLVAIHGYGSVCDRGCDDSVLLVYDSAGNDGFSQQASAFPYPSENIFSLGITAYSSPAIVDLNGDEEAKEIVFGADAGRLYAVRYDASVPVAQRLKDDLPGWSGGKLLDPGYSISSSPVAANLIGSTVPEIVVGNDAGKTYILNPDGSVRESFDCTGGGTDPAEFGIYHAPAIGARRTGAVQTGGHSLIPGSPILINGIPMIVVGNRTGLFIVELNDYPPYNPGSGAWPSFHRNNARTGALPFAKSPIKGSIGGSVPDCAVDSVRLLYPDGSPVPDPIGDDYVLVPTGEGRFVFEQLAPGLYRVQFRQGGSLVQEENVSVTAGQMNLLSGVDCD